MHSALTGCQKLLAIGLLDLGSGPVPHLLNVQQNPLSIGHVRLEGTRFNYSHFYPKGGELSPGRQTGGRQGVQRSCRRTQNTYKPNENLTQGGGRISQKAWHVGKCSRRPTKIMTMALPVYRVDIFYTPSSLAPNPLASAARHHCWAISPIPLTSRASPGFAHFAFYASQSPSSLCCPSKLSGHLSAGLLWLSSGEHPSAFSLGSPHAQPFCSLQPVGV